jgi:hypothetical protein
MLIDKLKSELNSKDISLIFIPDFEELNCNQREFSSKEIINWQLVEDTTHQIQRFLLKGKENEKQSKKYFLRQIGFIQNFKEDFYQKLLYATLTHMLINQYKGELKLPQELKEEINLDHVKLIRWGLSQESSKYGIHHPDLFTQFPCSINLDSSEQTQERYIKSLMQHV